MANKAANPTEMRAMQPKPPPNGQLIPQMPKKLELTRLPVSDQMLPDLANVLQAGILEMSRLAAESSGGEEYAGNWYVRCRFYIRTEDNQ